MDSRCNTEAVCITTKSPPPGATPSPAGTPSATWGVSTPMSGGCVETSTVKGDGCPERRPLIGTQCAGDQTCGYCDLVEVRAVQCIGGIWEQGDDYTSCDQPVPGPVCTPGHADSCPCEDGSEGGVKWCNDDGTAFGRCICD